MAGRRQGGDSAARGALGLDSFGEVSGDQGLSLEKLSESFARLLGQGDEPYGVEQDANGTFPVDESDESIRPAEADQGPLDHDGAFPTEDPCCPVTPRSILEAILFVGHPDNQPLASQQIASLMRGVRAAEIDDLVRQLNQAYAAEGCPYHIESVAAGYRMTLLPAHGSLRAKFYRKTRQARLSQSAVDVLAIVAYRQPVTRDRVSKLRGRPCGAILTQLVRRQLLRIERRDDARHTAQYLTTDRFLDLFGLESLDDLPRGQELDPDG
jgi:segregation and condensation protein B